MSAAPMRHVLGLSAYYHDAAAALVREGVVIAAAQEERFSRRKNDERFPQHAVQFCLRHAGLEPAQLDAVAFYDKPITKFARLLESYLAVAPAGLSTFPRVLPGWLGEKLNLRKTLRDELPGLREDCPILFTEHHQAHAASAYLPSPFDAAAILTVDGVGEWATTLISRGSGNTIEALQELRFPHSLGLLYSAFTAYCGFRINSGEYKLMGLAPYGEPRYVRAIYEHLIDVKEDGSFWLNLDYFAFLRSFAMANERFHRLFDGPPRPPESPLEQRHLDAARSIQIVTEEILLKLARHARQLTGQSNLCLAGGVALNCVANGRILRERLFDRIWIQPAAGDAGGALGAALAVSVGPFGRPHRNSPACSFDAMQGSALGPEYADPEIEATLQAHGAVYERIGGGQLLSRTVELLAREKIVGWVQGRMEFGPRALGQRSILGDPRSPRMQSVMNLKVKFRESFRPFAPVVRRERVQDYFELETDSPYMLLVAPVRSTLRVERAAGPAAARAPGTDTQPTTPSPASSRALAPNLIERVNEPRSSIPAVTHVDYSARIQTVDRTQSPLLYALLEEWERTSGCGVLVNTSFNVRGEPIVCTPDDAYRCFVNTEMDYLVMGNFILERAAQPQREVRRTFEPVPD